jgi:inosine triphosphate pyrophosphatase/XTP/dITP diphosphohydrolase
VKGAAVATIKFVSSNRGKARVFADCVAAAGFTAEHVELALVEPQADTVEAVALAKAQQAFARLRAPLVVEDSGFCIDALAGFPGPYTKYVLGTVGVAGLLRLAGPLASRTCRFVGALVHVDGEGATHTFLDDRGAGLLAPEIDDTPCAGAWSALWSVFIPEGASRAIVALSSAEREALWTRWHAHSVYAQLARWLASRDPGAPRAP